MDNGTGHITTSTRLVRMRTTIDLAPDVAHPVDVLRRRRGVRRDVVINDLIRIGLARMQAPSPVFRQQVHSLGVKQTSR